MNRNSNIESSLDKWLSGEMTQEQVLAQIEMADAKDAERMLNAHKAAHTGLQDVYLKNQIQMAHQNFTAANSAGKIIGINKNQWKSRKTFSIAASIVLLLGLFFIYKQIFVGGENLYHQFYNDYYLINERSDNDLINDPLANLFNTKDYPKVLQMVTANPEAGQREKFIGGYAAFILDDHALAQKLFKEILEKNKLTDINLYNDEAEYFLGLSYLKNKEYDKAIGLFEKIRANSFHIYHEKVSNYNLIRIKILNNF
jgi:tetratricopeptide (TPR) repeat protein